MQIELNVKNQKLIYKNNCNYIVSDSINYLKCLFEFSEEWENYNKTVVFDNKKDDPLTVILIDNECFVPSEVLKGEFYISVYGTDGEIRITTNSVFIKVHKSGYKEGVTPAEPTLTVYETLLNEIQNFKHSHLHDNKTVLDQITEESFNSWEAAAEDINKKSDKPTIITSTDTEADITLTDNTEWRYAALSTLNITLPEELPDTLISSVIFTSGETATNLTYPEEIKMSGEDCIENIFVPIANKRYEVNIKYDGVYLIGIVGGVSI